MMARKKRARLKHPPHQKFKAFLVENKIKQKEIAELLGLSPVTINQKINGYLDFTWPEVERICDTYKIEYAVFKTLVVA
jgi:transcriptional regulator with XRE-family HTH domain